MNILQVRELLREKFPGLRTRADELPEHQHLRWPTAIPELDEQLEGGLPKSALNEFVAPSRGCGSALMIRHLLRTAANRNQFVALIDARDSFDAAAVEARTLSHLLWVRCRHADEALKATDLVLRDGNLLLVLLDLGITPEEELRRIPVPAWYRFQRLIEESTGMLVVFTPRLMVPPAEARVTVQARFGLSEMEAATQVKLTMKLEFEVSLALSTGKRGKATVRVPKFATALLPSSLPSTHRRAA
jgi:hypothetical protein